ncbi:MAG: ABC transporter permease [Oscillospiraceae bacterium]|jgi:NitT/TauT family transport system permease protein|nr:ABC transporter permease [Oscillospiraceae bacterium]
MKKEKIIYSPDHLKFLKKRKKDACVIYFFQISIFLTFILFWEILAKLNWIDAFLVSSPSRIFSTIIELSNKGQLWDNIGFTVFETILGFLFGTILGIIIATIIWYSPLVSKVSEPYLVVFNALPKVALGPIIIVWMGTNIKSIITMALLVSTIVSIINILSGFKDVNREEILLMRSFGASKTQILTKLVLPANISTIVSTLKINVGMSLIGVITGEFLVSTKGIGYLIVYGGQIFKLDLVMAGIFILGIIASIMYIGVAKLEHACDR